MPLLHYLYIFMAAILAGGINALAGGGTLITFPVLVGVGLSDVAANVTNSTALLPGYLGATFAQRKDLAGQGRRLAITLPAAAAGGLIGGLLLLNTGEKLFRELVPFLILGASLLLAAQDMVRAWLLRRQKEHHRKLPEAWIALPVGLASVYGGYFGAGLSVIVLAVLGVVIEDNLTRLNAIKQLVGFVTNLAAVMLFVFSGLVNWPAALVMMGGALVGGALGGRLAGQVKPAVLRRIVVAIGIAVALIYFVRG